MTADFQFWDLNQRWRYRIIFILEKIKNYPDILIVSILWTITYFFGFINWENCMNSLFPML